MNTDVPKRPTSLDGYRLIPDIDYLGPHREERLDLFLPADAPGGRDRSPGVVIIHGGGWSRPGQKGKREYAIAADLCAAGYVCASIDYRVVDLERPASAREVYPRNLEDCRQAAAFLIKHADKYGVDPDAIGLIGGSAGGHLAALSALSSPNLGIRAAVCLYPVGDIPHWHRHAPREMRAIRAAELMLGGTPQQAPDAYREFSPVSHAGPDSPPLLIVHGSLDPAIPVDESRHFHRRLREAGAASELIVVPGAGHSFDLQPPQMDLRPQVLAFLDQHLRSG